MHSCPVTQPWGPHSWAGAAQTQATPSWLLFLSRTKHMHRDHMCWPGPEVRPCLNPLVHQQSIIGVPSIEKTSLLCPLCGESSGGSSTGLCASLHTTGTLPCGLCSTAGQRIPVPPAQTEHQGAQESLHNQPQASKRSRVWPKRHL